MELFPQSGQPRMQETATSHSTPSSKGRATKGLDLKLLVPERIACSICMLSTFCLKEITVSSLAGTAHLVHDTPLVEHGGLVQLFGVSRAVLDLSPDAAETQVLFVISPYAEASIRSRHRQHRKSADAECKCLSRSCIYCGMP